MELSDLILSIKDINFDEGSTPLIYKVECALKLVKSFNEKNESSFHFTYKTDSVLGETIYFLLNRTMIDLNKCTENNELKNSLYALACSIFDAIRILSRDTDVINTFHNDQLLKLIQKVVDLSDWVLNEDDDFKTSDNNTLVLAGLKSMSNLIYNSKYIQTFYAKNELAGNISVYLKSLTMVDKELYTAEIESNTIIFKLKILFLLTVFNKELSPSLCDTYQLITVFNDMILKFDLKKVVDCNIAVEILRTLYNLTMDIECVRLQAKDTLTALKPSEKDYCDRQNSRQLKDTDLLTFKSLCANLRLLLTVKNSSNDKSLVNPTMQNDIVCNTINLLTNVPSICFDELIPAIEQSDKSLCSFENRNLTAISSILEFLSENLMLYANHKIPVDILYPVLMLCSVMAKSNTTIRHYLRNKILPPLTKIDLVNLPQNGKTTRNFLVKMMTDTNLQLKRLCAQFVFILCKESVDRLIKYTGYGNAAGLLAEAGLMLDTHGDKAAYSSDSDSDSEDYLKLEKDINPITGQAEVVDEINLMNKKEQEALLAKKKRQEIFDGMSEEQKEYEAMQLANAIDKLTRMGSGLIKPATIGPDGKPCELEHVLQLQEKK